MLQVIASLAMEEPASGGAEALRDARTRILQSIETIEPANVVRGQFRGYRNEKGVASDSGVETFAALRLSIDSWRWGGVPFYVRTGKCMPITCTEVLVTLKPPPRSVFGEVSPKNPDVNYLRFRLSPDVSIALGVRTKLPGERMIGRDGELVACAADPEEMEPYERLLGDAMRGDPTLFAREDAVEAEWRIVAPLVTPASCPPHEYDVGTWGPKEADQLMNERVNDTHGLNAWHEPQSTKSS